MHAFHRCVISLVDVVDEFVVVAAVVAIGLIVEEWLVIVVVSLIVEVVIPSTKFSLSLTIVMMTMTTSC